MVCTIWNSILDAEALIRCHKSVFLTVIYMEKNREKFCPIFATSNVHEYKYLGVILTSGNGLCFSATSTIRSFHRAANCVLHGRVKPNQQVLMRLIYSNCVPILTYACAVKEYSAADMRRCHVALNNAIRKIFSFAVWQSIRHLRISHGFKCIYELFERAKRKFISSASNSSNTVIARLASLEND